jgi:hypothetical protein
MNSFTQCVQYIPWCSVLNRWMSLEPRRTRVTRATALPRDWKESVCVKKDASSRASLLSQCERNSADFQIRNHSSLKRFIRTPSLKYRRAGPSRFITNENSNKERGVSISFGRIQHAILILYPIHNPKPVQSLVPCAVPLEAYSTGRLDTSRYW